MATTSTRPSADGHRQSFGAFGLIAFAGVMMLLAGTLQALQGLVAILNDSFFVVGQEYALELDTTTWGWIHLVLGLIVACAGVALFQGATWARAVAIALASLSVVASFLWMPSYPFWSILLIALDVLVIWAVTTHGGDLAHP